ncbi:hypothetical protein ACFW9O_13870 [Streptomyces sp. NPDC059499]|uniref:hypothetical protein n=1 Tax=Streptomyces sp. NPDC059499 TaxID=3346852 RepID=UPI003685F6A8
MSPCLVSAGVVENGGDLVEYVQGRGVGHAHMVDEGGVGCGRCLTPTVLDGVPALRAAFSNWQTTEADVRRVATALRAAMSTTAPAAE